MSKIAILLQNKRTKEKIVSVENIDKSQMNEFGSAIKFLQHHFSLERDLEVLSFWFCDYVEVAMRF